MMKIAMVSTIRPVTNYARYLIGAVQKNFREEAEILVYADRNKENVDISLQNVNLVWSRNILYPLQIVRQALRDKLDVIHLQHEINMYGDPLTAAIFPLLLFLLRLIRVKIIVTVHAVVGKKEINKEFVEMFSQKKSNLGIPVPLVRCTMSFIYSSICLFAHKVIVHADCLKKMLTSDYGGRDRDIEIIPHGVPDGIFEQKDSLPLNYSPENNWINDIKDKKIILSFGYLVKRKGVEYLIEAFSKVSSKFPEYILILAGGTLQREYAESLKSLVESRGLGSKVIFTSFINRQKDLDMLFGVAEFVVLPGIQSISASGPLAQTMHYGKPVIVAHTGVFSEDIENQIEGLSYQPKEIKSLENAIIALITNPTLREKLAVALKEKAKTRFWSAISSKTFHVYKDSLKPRRKKIFLLGAYGYGNTGDEGLLQVMIDKFREFDITVNSFNPDLISKRFGIDSVSTFSRRDFKKRFLTFIKADVLIYGGGTLFIEYWRTLWSLFILNLCGRICGKKIIFLGIGVGNLRSKFLPRAAVHLADVISLRDRESADILRGVGANKQLHITADPAFLLTPADSSRIDKVFAQENISDNGLLVGLSPRTITELKYYKKYKQAIAQIADYLIETYNARIVFIPMHKNVAHFKPEWLYNIWWYDEEVASEIYNQMKNGFKATIIKGDYIPKEVLGVISRMKLFIGSPLHALIYAAICDVPFIGMEYCANDNSKISSFFKAMQEEEYLVGRYDDSTYEKFKSMIDSTFSHMDMRKRRLEEKVKLFKERAESNFRLFSI